MNQTGANHAPARPNYPWAAGLPTTARRAAIPRNRPHSRIRTNLRCTVVPAAICIFGTR